ncbi:Apoptosis-inducing factor 1, mitochondrial [Cyanidiococcus yangmingshanensis]|uniref:Apoptosis-inducing factor 1, mitochondrial n=1 Tax=Cyanidiococcus yangmingshanensis TaxID=2690220 RepID=A0A7J7ING7_9RHOD|nr:Apoptosis-inducing factor 1, mitochondrial [Cyanidiococcus yangmingshanensis]
MLRSYTRRCWRLFSRIWTSKSEPETGGRYSRTRLAGQLALGLGAGVLSLCDDRVREQVYLGAAATNFRNLYRQWPWESLTEAVEYGFWSYLNSIKIFGAPWSAIHKSLLCRTLCEAQSTSLGAKTLDQSAATIGSAYHYVIVGGGPAAHEAAAELAQCDSAATLLLMTDVDYDPVWSAEQCKRWVSHHRAFHRGYRLEALDVERKLVKFEGTAPIRYERLLLATGQENRCPQSCVIGPNASEYFVPAGLLYAGYPWREANEAMHFTLVGVDWYACVVASEIRAASGGLHSVTMLLPESEPLGEFLPKEIAKQVAQSLRGIGVELVSYGSPRYIRECADSQPKQADAEVFFTRTYDQSIAVSFRTDRFTFMEKHRPPGGAAVLGGVPHLHIDPVHEGIVCNRELMAASDVYVAGDALCFPDPVLGPRRAWGLDHATQSARVAARNMSGSRLVYSHQPIQFFRFANLEFLWVGDLDSSNETYQFVCAGVEASKDQNDGLPSSAEHAIVVYVRERSTVSGILWVRSTRLRQDADSEVERVNRTDVEHRMTTLLGQKVPSYGGSNTASDKLEPKVREIFQCITPLYSRMRRRHSGSTTASTSGSTRRNLVGNRRRSIS